MIAYPNGDEWVRNVKSGKQGKVVCRYNRTNDGKAMTQVDTGLRMAYWLTESVEAA